MVNEIHQDRLKQKFIRISTKKGGSTMKIYGDELNPSILYKTFLLSIKDTAEWIVKEMLENYGLKHENSQNYCLVQINIPPYNQIDNKIIKEIILHDKECPLNIYLNHIQKSQGSIVFKVMKCLPEYIEIRKRLHTEDRIISDHLSFFIEVNKDGTDLPIPRVVKLYPNTTYVGRDIKTEYGSQYFYIDEIGIHRNHCTIENQNEIVKIIPKGEIWLDKKLISTPFILQHKALICFGQNSTFRYYNQKRKSILTQKNENKLSMYNSLPLLSTNNLQPVVIEKKISTTDVVNTGPKFNVLPGLLEVPSETEIRFLHAIFDNYSLNNIHFRLLPVYAFYMTLRHRLSSYRKSNLSSTEKQEDVISFLYRIEDMINKKIEECQQHVGYLAYWLANTSEFLYFLKHDRDLSKISYDIQIRLFKYIQNSFYYLINNLQNELDKYLIAFTNPRDIHITINKLKFSEKRWIIFDTASSNEYHQPTIDDILALLSSIIDLLCKCRVNPELTIEIFSQLFYYINIQLFNRIVCCSELKLCSQIWGEKLSFRLKSLHNWALKQGLELPSECYLMQINQLCLLLQNPKRDMYDVEQLISKNLLQINSIQISQILNNYILSQNEPPISKNFSQALLSIACKHADENLHNDGFIIQLAEKTDLNLPFILPEDGYVCENLRGIPQPLLEFIEPICRLGLCRLFINSYSLGLWTEFIQILNIDNGNDQIKTIILNKKGNSLGLIIVSAKNESQQSQGIYIKGIIPGSAAEDNGHLQPGDQILRVDQIDLLNATHEQATKVLKQCGPLVTLKILKDAANHHGLSALFTTPSKNYYQSNPNLFHSQQKFDNFNRNISKTRSFIIREDIPSESLKISEEKNNLLKLQQNKSE